MVSADSFVLQPKIFILPLRKTLMRTFFPGLTINFADTFESSNGGFISRMGYGVGMCSNKAANFFK